MAWEVKQPALARAQVREGVREATLEGKALQTPEGIKVRHISFWSMSSVTEGSAVSSATNTCVMT